MLTDEIKELGLRISNELNSHRESTTKVWMAHYIAELMHQADHDDDPSRRAEAAQECADLVLKLWEMQKEQTQVSFRSIVYSKLYETYEKRPGADDIRQIMEDPSLLNDLEHQLARDIILFALSDVEADLLRLRICGVTISEVDQNDTTKEVLTQAAKFIEIYDTTIKHLKDIWEHVTELTLNNPDDIQAFVSAQLLKIQDIRNRLINSG